MVDPGSSVTGVPGAPRVNATGGGSATPAATLPELISATERGSGAWVIYDGECPICRAYTARLRIQEAVGRLHLLDARQLPQLVGELASAGFDVDDGMVVVLGGALYFGADAVWMLSRLSTRSSWFNRLFFLAFRNRDRARLFYPFAKSVRRILLGALGRTRLQSGRPAL